MTVRPDPAAVVIWRGNACRSDAWQRERRRRRRETAVWVVVNVVVWGALLWAGLSRAIW